MATTVMSRRTMLGGVSGFALVTATSGCCIILPCPINIDDLYKVYKTASDQVKNAYGAVTTAIPSLILPEPIATAIKNINDSINSIYTAYNDIVNAIKGKDIVANILDALVKIVSAGKSIAAALNTVPGVSILSANVVGALNTLVAFAQGIGSALRIGIEIAQAAGVPIPQSVQQALLPPPPAAAPAPPPGATGALLAAPFVPLPNAVFDMDAAFRSAATAPAAQARLHLSS